MCSAEGALEAKAGEEAALAEGVEGGEGAVSASLCLPG